MKKLISSLVLAIAGAVSSTACAESFRAEDTVLIRGVIAGKTMEPVYSKMNEFLVQDQTPSTVKLIIDSPGGSVYAGLKLISQMKSLQGKGTKFVCYVPGLAASMAFHILVHCDKRVVLQESALLWHRARVFILFGVITSPVASALARDLQAIDEHILKDVSSVLRKDLSAEDISYHFEHETLHIGEKLCNSAPSFCTAKSHIPGLMEALNNPALLGIKEEKEEDSMDPADMFTGMESIVYIYKRFLDDMGSTQL